MADSSSPTGAPRVRYAGLLLVVVGSGLILLMVMSRVEEEKQTRIEGGKCQA